MVMSAQGGMTPAMGAVLHAIADSVATVEGNDATAIRKDLFERPGIAVARANARAVARCRISRPGAKLAAASIAEFGRR